MNCSFVGRPASANSRIPSERAEPISFLVIGCCVGTAGFAAWAFTLSLTLAAACIFRLAVLRVTPVVFLLRLIADLSFRVRVFFFAIASLHAPDWCWSRTIPRLSEKLKEQSIVARYSAVSPSHAGSNFSLTKIVRPTAEASMSTQEYDNEPSNTGRFRRRRRSREILITQSASHSRTCTCTEVAWPSYRRWRETRLAFPPERTRCRRCFDRKIWVCFSAKSPYGSAPGSARRYGDGRLRCRNEVG